MVALVWRIMAFAYPREIQIRARHIPGKLNVRADALSRRNKVLPTEWSLHPQVFHKICQVWHTPNLDMFATALNHKLPVYVSPTPDPEAWEVDALSIPWQDLNGYAFPPVAILPRVIQKMHTYQCIMIVIAPGWPSMPWFWDLVDLAIHPPLRLPLWGKLLKQSHMQVFHNSLEYLNLHAWCLDPRSTSHLGFQKRWKTELEHLNASHLGPSISQGGPYLGNGVNRIRWMSQTPLFPT